MYKKVFLDANIIIDSQDTSRKNYKDSSDTIDFLLSQRVKLYTSCELITTIYYILSKNSKQEALSTIEKLSSFCNIIDFSNNEVEVTCRLMRENKNYIDLENTMQYILAQKEKCDLIISNDKNFKSDKIELLTSREFCKKEELI